MQIPMSWTRAKGHRRRALSYSHIQQRRVLEPRDRLAGTWAILGPTSSVYTIDEKADLLR